MGLTSAKRRTYQKNSGRDEVDSRKPSVTSLDGKTDRTKWHDRFSKDISRSDVVGVAVGSVILALARLGGRRRAVEIKR